MNNKVNFLRGTSTEYAASTKDNDTFYYTTDDEKLYLGRTEITSIEIDDTSVTATDKTWSAKKISEHSGNADIHVTTEDKTKWNAVNYSNPNLSINPDFRINQRGQAEYTAAGYTVDRWTINEGSVTINGANGIVLTNNSSTAMRFRQYLDIDFSRIAGKILSLSVCIDGKIYTDSGVVPYEKPAEITQIIQIAISDNIAANLTFLPSKDAFDLYLYVGIGASFAISWVKLELGSIATPFVPPDTATELAKCQRFYQIRSTNDIAAVDLRPSMATIKDIKLREDGNYEYIAELR